MKLAVKMYPRLVIKDRGIKEGFYETSFGWEYHMKVYAKGCDAPGCTQEAEVDHNLGRPVDWYFVSVRGGARAVDKTIIVCRKCYEGPMATSVLMQLPVVAP